jgi:predicted nucleotidyltransferase
MTEIVSRRKTTSDRLATIRVALADSANLSKGKACVYATGSFGRGEAGKFSDLDLFIVGKGPAGKSDLRRLDEICIKADLIEVTKKNGLPEFSGDGRYLIHYSVGDLVKTVGTPEDDALNTFTARLLLLLESKPLVEPDVYLEIIDEIIIAYWRDYEDHKSSFMPAYLANDILRLWRTFCVNYEARSDREPDFEKARGKIKNYKLKHSRLLTCFSAIIYLLAIFNKSNTVHPADA